MPCSEHRITAPGGEPQVVDVERYRIAPGSVVSLGDYDPGDAGGLSKKRGVRELKALKARLNSLQELLYANGTHALLVVLQGMDTSGKDGVIKRVITAFNPQGFRVTSFKAPTEEELAHDFLWRVHKEVPRRGMVGVFNRSHYEDVLVVRVDRLVPEDVWRARYEAIRQFEELLVENGVVLCKFFLHISRDEQRVRLQARLDDPEKRWKFRSGDLSARAKWDAYMTAYEVALEQCSTQRAPWYVVPANRKWFRDLVVAQALVNSLASLGMTWPELEAGAEGLTID